MDQDVINLAKAIRQAESGNRAVLPAEGSKLGGKSRYQYTNDTWKGVASKYLGSPNAPITLENENKATYLRIKEWKDKGYNPAQIASMWNAGEGRPDAYKQNWRGVNKYGVAYDTPKYVNKVYSLYKQQKGEQAPQGPSTQPPTVQMQRIERQQQGLPVARNQDRVEPTLGGSIARDILKTPARLLENIKAIPKAIRGESIEQINQGSQSQYFGGRIAPIGTKPIENIQDFGQNLKESIGAGLEMSSYLPIAGVASKTAKAIPTLSKLTGKEAGKVALKRIGMNTVEGAVGTAMFEGGKRMQGDTERGNFLENVAYGAGGGLALGALGAGLSRGVRQARRTIASVGGNIPQDIAEESTQRLKGAWTELNDNYKDLRNFRNKQAKYGRNIEDVLTEEVMVPEIKDGKVDVQKLLPEVDARIQKQAEQVTEFAKKFDDMPVPIKDVEAIAEKVIRETESITATGELKSALSEVARRMEGIREVYGETLLPSQLNTIRVQMNQLTKAFGGDVFKQDVADAIADAVRDKLDEVIQDDVFRRANAKVGDLINVRKYLQKVDGKQVGGGRFSQAFAGVVGAKIGQGISKLPVIGELTGYAVGRGLTRQARQYAFGSAGPRTRAILRRMQRKNEVGAEIAEKTTKKKQLLLPARTSDNNVRLEYGRPINLPPRSQSSVDKTEMANIILQRSKKGNVFELNGKDLEITRVLEDGVMVVDNEGNKDFITKADIVGAKKVNPLFGEAEGEVVSEMLDLSVAGKRIMKEDGSFMAQKSTFPKWISEDLRSMSLFKSVINKIKENKPIRGSKEQRLYNEIKDEITNRSVRKSDELAKAGEISLAQKANEMSLEDFTKFYEENKATVKPVDDIKKFWEENNFGGEQAFGAIAGMEIDENGEIKFNKDKALMGVAGMVVAKKAGLMPKPKAVLTKLENPIDLKTKRPTVVSDVTGLKVNIPQDTVIKAGAGKGSNMIIDIDGTRHTINKNQFQNLKGQSLVAEAREFAPELKQVEETVLGVGSRGSKADAMRVITDNGYSIEEEMMDFSIKKGDEYVEYDDLPKNVQKAFNKIVGDAETKADVNFGKATRYSQYTLPDGKNYKEVLIKAPTRENSPYQLQNKNTEEILKEFPNYKEASKYLQSIKGDEKYQLQIAPTNNSPEFKSSHWDEPNVISHLRLNERTYKGKKVTFMEELQSDWAREGRSKGFTNPNIKEPQLPDGWRLVSNGDTFQVVDRTGQRVPDKLMGTDFAYGGNREIAIAKAIGDDSFIKSKNGIPNNPLLKNWQELTIKRALKDAVDNDAKYFAWINGDQTSARYNLATHVKTVEWGKSGTTSGKKIYVNAQSGKDIIIRTDETGTITKGESVPAEWVGKKLDEVLGKGLADKIMEKESGTLAGEGLKFGGEWASNLYDKQVKNIVEDLTGTKVQEVDLKLPIEGKEPIWIIQSGRDIGAKPRPTDLKVGMELNQMNKGDYIVIDVLGDGKFKAVPNTKTFIQDNYSTKDILEWVENNPNFVESFDISKKTTKQLGIEITPEVKAIIKGEAPRFSSSKKSLPAEVFAGVPLIFNLFGEKVIEDNEEYKVTKSGFLGNKITFERKPQPLKEVAKPIPDEKIGNALLQLESSGGTDKRNADQGEMKWLVGLTELAIKELQRVKKLPENFNKNNREKIIEAGVAYFKLMQERNPNMSPAEVYVDKYWTQWKNMPKPQEARTKKIEEFNKLVSL